MSSTTFDFQMSLYIPRVFSNIDEERIINIFENDLEIGKIKNIDFVSKLGADGRAYNSIYIHFEQWNQNTMTMNLQAKIKEELEPAKIVYEDPWHWIVLENKGKKQSNRKICLDLSEHEHKEEQNENFPLTRQNANTCEYIPTWNNNYMPAQLTRETRSEFAPSVTSSIAPSLTSTFMRCAITGNVLEVPLFDRLEQEVYALRFEMETLKQEINQNQKTIFNLQNLVLKN